MGINIKTPGVHHVTLRVADFRRSKQFYTETLGFPIALEQPDLLIILAGNTAVGLRAPVGEPPKCHRANPPCRGTEETAPPQRKQRRTTPCRCTPSGTRQLSPDG